MWGHDINCAFFSRILGKCREHSFLGGVCPDYYNITLGWWWLGGCPSCPWDSRSHKKTVFRDCQLFQLNDVTVWGQGSILENGMVLFLVAKCKTASNNSSQDIQSFWRFQIILKKIHSGLARISWSKGGHRIIFGGILSSRAALDHLRMAREWRIYTAEGPPVIYAPLSSPFSWVIYFLVLTGTQYYIERSGIFSFQLRNICIGRTRTEEGREEEGIWSPQDLKWAFLAWWSKKVIMWIHIGKKKALSRPFEKNDDDNSCWKENGCS